MPDNFLYSSLTEDGYTNMVTAEDLNNIAVDLGYADYSHFPEDPPQSAVSALNQITQDLTSKGILQIGNCCKVSMTDGVITVADGVCVFESGAKKRLTEPVTLSFIKGSVNYVYMLNNITENRIQLVTSIENPAESEDPIDYVMLAEISSGGTTVTERRYWSISKVGNGKNIVLEFTQKFLFLNDDNNGNARYSEYEFDISQCGANYFIYLDEGEYYVDAPKSPKYSLAIPLQEGVEIDHALNFRYFPEEKMLIKKAGTKLYIKTSRGTKNQSSTSETITFWIV